MEQNKVTREIRIFISSTFRDMNDERDYLITKVFPRLQAEAAKRDVSVVPVDLRWGVTEEESKTGKVIQICLQEIENSHPFFVGLIGNRYGWCPTMEEVEKNDYLKDNWGEWLEKDINDGLSVTEIEMQYGVLRRKQNKKKEPFYKRWLRKERSDDGNDRLHAYFYIRKNSTPDSENSDKLQRLRDNIRNNGSYPVYDYDSPEGLGKQVEKDFMTLLDQLYPQKSLSRLEKEHMAQTAFLKSRTSIYIPTISNMEILDAFMLDKEKRNLVIIGESGIGKSALLANWIQRHENNHSCNIIYHFVGYGGGTENSQNILEHLIDEIRSNYNVTQIEDNNRNLFEQLEYAYSQIYDQKPFIIVLDGINQLSDVSDAKLLNWLPNPPQNGKMLFSTIESDRTMQTFKIRKYDVCGLIPLDENGKREFVNKYLLKFSKKLTDEQVNRIVQDSQNENLHALQTLLNELIIYGNYEKLNQRINYYLNAESLDEFYNLVIERYETDYGKDRIQSFLSLIAFSQYGLSETELLELTREAQLRWSQFFCAFKYQLLNRNGVLTFSHQQIHNAVLARYHNEEKRYRQQIINYFERNQNSRSLEEIPYQYYQLGDPDKLYKTLTDLNVLYVLLSKDKESFGFYWAWLRNIDSARYPIEVYLDILVEKDTNTANLCSVLSEIIGDKFTLYELQLKLYTRALEIDTVVFGEKHPNNVYNLCNIGFIHNCLNDFHKSLEAYKHALSISIEVNGKESISVASLYSKIGFVYYNAVDYNNSKMYYEKALNISEKSKERTNTNTLLIAEIISKLAGIYDVCNEKDKALDYYKKALDMLLPLLGENNSLIPAIYNNIALIYDKKKEYQTELSWLKKALKIQRIIYPVENSHISVTLANTAIAYANMGMYKISLEFHAKALSLREKYFGFNHAETAASYNSISTTYYFLKDYDTALAYLQKALKSYLAIYDNNHVQVKHVMRQLNQVIVESMPKLYLSAQANFSTFPKLLETYARGEQVKLLPFLYELRGNSDGVLQTINHIEAVGEYKYFVCFTRDDEYEQCNNISSIVSKRGENLELIIIQIDYSATYTPFCERDAVQWIGNSSMTTQSAAQSVIEHILQFDKLRKELEKECRSILERSRFDSMSISELERYVKESESPNAGMELGCRYIAGTEVPHDIHKGINTFLTTAANGGEGPVGIWHFLDKYVGLFNCKEIERLKDIAWRIDSSYAAYLYAHCVELRRGAKSYDFSKVKELYETSANMGNSKAKEALNRLKMC